MKPDVVTIFQRKDMDIMNVNGITSNTQTTTNYDVTNTQNTAKQAETATNKTFTDEAAVYESKSEQAVDRSAIIAKMKQDVEDRTAQLRSLVEKMFLKQGQTLANADDMWKFLASGDYEVDEATAAQAKEDISEDGYWGVKQTSERIFDFAMALSGGDKDKMEEMLEAFEEGFSQATEAWGKELPEISQQTYDAVQEKFAAYFDETTE